MITKKYLDILALVFISILLFFFKWLYTFIAFFNEDLFLKILNNSISDGYFYFPFIKLLSNFDFTNNLDGSYNENYYLPIPYGSIFIHAFFYKIFGNYSFIFLEFVSILIFLLIFYYICIYFKINKLISILLSVFFFCFPTFLSLININNFQELKTFSDNFYNLRFPRPLIVNLYFFFYLLMLIYSFNNCFFKKKNIFLFSILLGLTFSSAFYIFIFQFFSLIAILLYKYKFRVFNLIKHNYKKILLAFILFLILTLPFLYLLNFSSEDYLRRLGLIYIDKEKKIYLLKYYFYKLFRIKTILLYFFLYFCIYTFNKKMRMENLFILNIFFINFFCSIFSILFFICFTNKISYLYHFNNLVLINLVLFLIFIFLYIVIFLFKKNYFYLNFKYSFLILLMLFIFFYNYLIYKEERLIDMTYRHSQNEIVSKLKEISYNFNKEASLLSFDYPLIKWAIFNNINEFLILGGNYSLKSDNKIEKDLIISFKILNLSKEDFINFIDNKRRGYRYINSDIQSILFSKYQANSLTTFNNSKNFSEEINKFISNSSPLYMHQIIIPNDEIFRLKDLFDKIDYNLNYIPRFIVISKKHLIIGKSKVNNNLYNKVLDNEHFILYEKRFIN